MTRDLQLPERNIMLTLSYVGTNYCGWQIQPNGITIQECVERAVGRLTGTRSSVLCAGRTDSGVHALGQIANFRTSSTIPTAQMRRGLQSYLPHDIVVVDARDVSPEFHATYSAVSKTYRYVLFDAPICPPFLNKFVARSRRQLDVPAMQKALPYLLGTHDFRCFETHYPNKQTSVRTIHNADISRKPMWMPWCALHAWEPSCRISLSENVDPNENIDPNRDGNSAADDSPIIVFEVTADGFLYNMVRAIVGTLLRIGDGRREPGDMGRVVASLDRTTAGMTTDACGLYLVEVRYPESLFDVGGFPIQSS